MDCETGIQGALGLSLSELDDAWREQALGQNALGAAFRNMLPYVVLLLVVMLVPLLAGIGKRK
jgi:hypothetical protein